jgi:hypothetical protein
MEQVVRCEIREDLDFGVDHYPISTSFLLRTTRVEPILRRSGKRMDIEAGAVYLPRHPAPMTPDRIDDYANSLIQFIQQLIEQTGSYYQVCRQKKIRIHYLEGF